MSATFRRFQQPRRLLFSLRIRVSQPDPRLPEGPETFSSKKKNRGPVSHGRGVRRFAAIPSPFPGKVCVLGPKIGPVSHGMGMSPSHVAPAKFQQKSGTDQAATGNHLSRGPLLARPCQQRHKGGYLQKPGTNQPGKGNHLTRGPLTVAGGCHFATCDGEPLKNLGPIRPKKRITSRRGHTATQASTRMS